MSFQCLHVACVGVVWLGVCQALVFAQAGDSLAEWRAPPDVVARLGERYSDALISIAPPHYLQRVDRPNSPEMTKKGVYHYGWTASGVYPSAENLVVVLTPFKKPSSEALDEAVEGLKDSIEQGLEDVQWENVRRGRLNGVEVRAGKYTAQVAGEKATGFYLIGIDTVGTFGVTAMMPESKATPEKIKELQSSMLTFERGK
jgi:hypothetical protein